MSRDFLINGNPQNVPKKKGGNNMFYCATKEQMEHLYPDLITMEPGKMRIFYKHEDEPMRMVDRCNGYYFSDKPWGLPDEKWVEGLDQEFVYNEKNSKDKPMTEEEGYLSLNIRNAIKAPDGWTFVSCDYSAEELRLGALNTKSKVFMKAFKEGIDVHLQTATMMFGEEAVKANKKKLRSIAKGCNSVDAYYLTKDGYKRLEDTDHILDLNGNKQKFGYVVEDRDMYRLYLSNGQIIDVTTNHKFKDMGMVYPEFKEVYEGMQIPLVKAKNKRYSTNYDYMYNYKVTHHNNLGSWDINKSYNLRLDYDLGYLIGIYLGDGYIPTVKEGAYPKTISVCCHHSNADYLEHIMNKYKSKRKNSKPCGRHNDNNFVILSLGNTALSRFIVDNFGCTKTKHVGDIIYQAPYEFSMGIVSGLIDSDGKVGPSSASFGQTSELLHRTVANLFSFVGIPVHERISSYTYKDKSKPFYYLEIDDMRDINLHVSYKKDILDGQVARYLGYKLNDLKDSTYNGKYYDKLNMIHKGLLNNLTYRAIEKYIPTMEHANYYPVTINKIENVKGKANIMECETHYYIAEGFESPNCNFGLQYGGSWMVMKTDQNTKEEAQQQYDAYMLAMADHFAVQKAQVRKTKETLTETSFFGLPVRLHNYYKSQNNSVYNSGERLAKNHRIQATGADIMSIAYIRLWNNLFCKIKEPEKFIRFQVSVHDEIDFIIKNEAIPILIPEVIKNMQVQMPDWEIPLTIGLSMGPTFGAQYEWNYDPQTFQVLTPALEDAPKPKPKEEIKEEETIIEEPKQEEEITLEF